MSLFGFDPPSIVLSEGVDKFIARFMLYVIVSVVSALVISHSIVSRCIYHYYSE